VRRTLLPSEMIQQQIDDLLGAGPRGGLAETLSEIAQMGAQQLIQRVVELEVQEHLGRMRYERADGEPVGYRNGYRSRKLQTGEGVLEVQVPQLRECATPFVSAVIPRGKRVLRTRPLEALVIGAFVRGLSMRDVESLTVEATGGRVTRTVASRICSELRERYDRFRSQRLDDIELAVLFLDAIWLPVRPAGEKECVLVAWGIDTSGQRQLLALQLGNRESTDAWLDLGRGLTARGLAAPLLAVSDGAPGLIAAIEQLWPGTDRQRCTVHKLRNITAKLPEREHDRVKAAYWAALDNAKNVAEGRDALHALARTLAHEGYASVAECLRDDLDALVVHLNYPLRHRKRWRSTNLLERSLGEVRRRTKVIGRFPGETSCLSLAWAVLDLFITGQNSVRFTDLDRAAFAKLKRGDEPADTQPDQAAA
jgi:putative transposase